MLILYLRLKIIYEFRSSFVPKNYKLEKLLPNIFKNNFKISTFSKKLYLVNLNISKLRLWKYSSLNVCHNAAQCGALCRNIFF